MNIHTKGERKSMKKNEKTYQKPANIDVLVLHTTLQKEGTIFEACDNLNVQYHQLLSYLKDTFSSTPTQFIKLTPIQVTEKYEKYKKDLENIKKKQVQKTIEAIRTQKIDFLKEVREHTKMIEKKSNIGKRKIPSPMGENNGINQPNKRTRFSFPQVTPNPLRDLTKSEIEDISIVLQKQIAQAQQVNQSKNSIQHSSNPLDLPPINDLDDENLLELSQQEVEEIINGKKYHR